MAGNANDQALQEVQALCLPVQTAMTSNRCFLGIDPGASGGLVWLDEFQRVRVSTKMPATPEALNALLVEHQFITKFVVIEWVHAMPRQDVGGMSKFMEGFGILQGLLIANRIPFRRVAPRSWQAEFDIPKRDPDAPKSAFKNLLKAKAQELFPEIKVTLALADALLIAEFCRRKYA